MYYTKPTTEVIEILTQQMIASSDVKDNTTVTDPWDGNREIEYD